ncbi:ArsR family transcriptional regulator [Candidatus Bathyarchaeota archaeon]|nr:ArsR family transcriptional regulator [Candidatus Bathyarchaeota archaeon]
MKSKTVANSMEETKDRHKRYLRAISNPIRRSILIEIKNGHNTFETIINKTGIDERTLEWHLQILEGAYCISRKNKRNTEDIRLTQEGKVIDYLEK